jgi:hypothetical protein
VILLGSRIAGLDLGAHSGGVLGIDPDGDRAGSFRAEVDFVVVHMVICRLCVEGAEQHYSSRQAANNGGL